MMYQLCSFAVLELTYHISESNATGDEAEAIEPVEVVEPASEDGESTIPPTVWYSLGGVVAAIGAYCACCKKGDDGYARIQ
jgi:hypothetical protein